MKLRKQKTWVISDTHFGHSNILTFKNGDGSYLRDFLSIEEMDEHIIDNWNNCVHKDDKIYHLGDITFDVKTLHKIMPRLNGVKYLIRGNHDKFADKHYHEYFYKIWGIKLLHNIALTHCPLHPSTISGRWLGNVHGHVHKNSLNEPGYFNACVEVNNYSPIDFDFIRTIYE